MIKLEPAPARTQGAQPTVVVLLPMVWSVRNVVYSGALRRLADAGAAVHLLMRRVPPSFDADAHADFRHAASYEPLLEAPARRASGMALLDGVIKSAFSQRNRIGSYRIYERWSNRQATRAARLRTRAIDLAGAAAQRGPLFERLCHAREQRYRRTHDLAGVRAQLERLSPDLIWSTVCVAGQEYPYALAARDAGLPIVTSILSFDNLTSRGVLPAYDHYLAWNARMREQLMRFYPGVRASQVTVTGTPQFDFHRNPEFAWPRGQTLRRLGLRGEERYLLYSASHQSLTPAEPELVAGLAARMRDDAVLRSYRLVVRLHPLEDWRRWDAVCQAEPQIVRSPAWDAPPEPDGWTVSQPEDQARLISTIRHADVCLNIASTMSLDAAIQNRPIVGIDFSGEPASPRDNLYEEYQTEHYRPLVESGGLRVARSWGELVTLLRQALSDPERDGEARRRMVERECGAVDGQAAERVAAAVLQLARARALAR